MDGLIYLHNLAGQALSQANVALAQANARVAELEAEVKRLRESQQASPPD